MNEVSLPASHLLFTWTFLTHCSPRLYITRVQALTVLSSGAFIARDKNYLVYGPALARRMDALTMVCYEKQYQEVV
jgi:hypothetical protein